jgi:hypothetical protein
VAVLPLIASCSNDARVFASATTTVPDTSQPSGTAPPTTTTTTTEAPASSTTATTVAATAGNLTGEMLVAFTFAAAGRGPVRNPYVAVWIEDADGELVDTVALWILQSQKGLRYLAELRRWYSVDGTVTSIDTVSSATRSPGDYTVSWGMTDSNHRPVAAGQYYVCIEAAREHGPYSLIRESVAVDAAMAPVQLPDDGELTNAAVSLAPG